jgi:hypothetical protein
MLLYALALIRGARTSRELLYWIPPNSQRGIQIVSVETYLIINMLNNNKSYQKVKSFWEKFIPLNTIVSTDSRLLEVDLTGC